jgi:hypothetical protein
MRRLISWFLDHLLPSRAYERGKREMKSTIPLPFGPPLHSMTVNFERLELMLPHFDYMNQEEHDARALAMFVKKMKIMWDDHYRYENVRGKHRYRIDVAVRTPPRGE